VNILVVGSGGREHAIVWKLRQSSNVKSIFCAPGNAGTSGLATNVEIAQSDIEGLVAFVERNAIDLTVIGPEQPLVLGLADRLLAAGRRVFGPTQAAARLEGSKVFSKDFMARNGIPTARYKTFGAAELTLAQEFVKSLKPPIVVKADGLAAGKGVLICPSREEALEGVREMTVAKSFGAAGERIVIEEYLAGEEASVFVITDGERYVTLAPAQDHKRVLDGDLGKNTGGMGAYAPAPLVTSDLLKHVEQSIILPTLEGMRREGTPYAGCLYVGLMIGDDGPKVLEYNCRFGDPEAQVVIPLIETDFAELLLSVSERRLAANVDYQTSRSAVCVVIASKGYPDAYEKGKPIEGLNQFDGDDRLVVFHAGTRTKDGRTVTSGGRVLGVTAIGEDLNLAATIRSAYDAVGKITFEGAYYRTDIGQKALRHLGRRTTEGTHT